MPNSKLNPGPLAQPKHPEDNQAAPDANKPHKPNPDDKSADKGELPDTKSREEVEQVRPNRRP